MDCFFVDANAADDVGVLAEPPVDTLLNLHVGGGQFRPIGQLGDLSGSVVESEYGPGPAHHQYRATFGCGHAV